MPEGPKEPSGEDFRRFFQDRPSCAECHRMHGTCSGVTISCVGTMFTNHHMMVRAQEVTVTDEASLLLRVKRDHGGIVVALAASIMGNTISL